MLITSPAFEHNGRIPQKFTCDGGAMNPELLIQNVPEEAHSLALIMEDPDAPNGTFTHWLVWDIDPGTTVIKEESVPSGAREGSNGRGSLGYTGPCPPSGVHRYFFKLYALDAINFIDLKIMPDKATLEAMLAPHIVARAELIGLYGR